MAHDHFVRYELYSPAPPPHPLAMRHHHLLPPAHHQGVGVAAGYEVTAGGAGDGGGGAPQSLSLPHQVHGPPDFRKRKSASYHGGSEDEDDTGDDSRSSRTAPDKKQNHSEIEKRRRDKMNTYIVELSALVPMCGAMARKLDKLTVLRMAVQHLRAVRGTLSACPLNARPRPSFLHERELNQLVLQAARTSCFLLVLSCDRARLLYVSASVQNLLLYEQGELLGQTLFDILHPKDVAKVKEQLSSSDLSPRERLIDAKTMLPVKTEIGGASAVGAGTSRFCPGARRSFFCRIKCKGAAGSDCTVKEELDAPSTKRRKPPPAERKYVVVQVTGYLKAWAPAETGDGSASAGEEGAASEEEACNMSCLVAVCRTLSDMLPSPSLHPTVSDEETRQLYFISRHATDGKFLFVDQRVTPALGFLPQELLSTSLYEYVSNSDLRVVAKAHKAALIRQMPHTTHPYSFRRKDGSYAVMQTHFKPFRNPWTKDVESLVAKNILVLEQLRQPQMTPHSFDLFGHEDDMEMQRLINSQMELQAIGAAIAEEALRREMSPDGSPPPGAPQPPPPSASRNHNHYYSAQAQVTARRACAELPPSMALPLPLPLLDDDLLLQQACAMAEAEGQTGSAGDGSGTDSLCQYPLEMEGACGAGAGSSLVRNNVSLAAAGAPVAADSPPLPPLSHDGNDEAAMAVIMSLLEADAGLGGPVDFSSLPWPLP